MPRRGTVARSAPFGHTGHTGHPSVGAGRRFVRRPSPRWTLQSTGIAAIVGLLVLVGLVMVLSASSVESLRSTQSSWSVFRRQAMWVAIATVAFGVTLRIPYWRLKSLTGPFFAICIALLALVTFTPLGITRNGSTRWIGPAGFQIQPSEFTKLALILVLAKLLDGRSHRIGISRLTLRPAMIYTLLVLVLVFLQPDMGTAMSTLFVAAAIIVVANVPLRDLARVGAVCAVLTVILGVVEPYRRDRILAFLHPDQDVAGIGYHLRQSLVGIGSGGFFGVGVGASRAKWGFLPNAHTDFIFSIIGEELGLIGGMLTVALFLALAVLGIQAAKSAPDRFGTLLATGITMLIVGQAIINIGAVIGIMPITGIPLPYVSAGGSSLVVIMAATGILVNVARHSVRPKAVAVPARRGPARAAVHPDSEEASATRRHPAIAQLDGRLPGRIGRVDRTTGHPAGVAGAGRRPPGAEPGAEPGAGP